MAVKPGLAGNATRSGLRAPKAFEVGAASRATCAATPPRAVQCSAHVLQDLPCYRHTGLIRCDRRIEDAGALAGSSLHWGRQPATSPHVGLGPPSTPPPAGMGTTSCERERGARMVPMGTPATRCRGHARHLVHCPRVLTLGTASAVAAKRPQSRVSGPHGWSPPEGRSSARHRRNNSAKRQRLPSRSEGLGRGPTLQLGEDLAPSLHC